MKYALGAAILITSIFFAKETQAGGCCYKSFSSNPGEANVSPATISVAFVDPTNPFADEGKTTLSSLKNQKVNIKIVSPKPGQTCTMKSEKTNDEGKIEAECTSPVPGAIKVYFEAPDIDSQYKQSFSSVAKPVTFTGVALSEPTKKPMVSVAPKSVKQTPKHTPEQKVQPSPSASPSFDETQALQLRVKELEQKVAEQEKEVTGLRAIIDKIMKAFGNFFGN